MDSFINTESGGMSSNYVDLTEEENGGMPANATANDNFPQQYNQQNVPITQPQLDHKRREAIWMSFYDRKMKKPIYVAHWDPERPDRISIGPCYESCTDLCNQHGYHYVRTCRDVNSPTSPTKAFWMYSIDSVNQPVTRFDSADHLATNQGKFYPDVAEACKDNKGHDVTRIMNSLIDGIYEREEKVFPIYRYVYPDTVNHFGRVPLQPHQQYRHLLVRAEQQLSTSTATARHSGASNSTATAREPGASNSTTTATVQQSGASSPTGNCTATQHQSSFSHSGNSTTMARQPGGSSPLDNSCGSSWPTNSSSLTATSTFTSQQTCGMSKSVSQAVDSTSPELHAKIMEQRNQVALLEHVLKVLEKNASSPHVNSGGSSAPDNSGGSTAPDNSGGSSAHSGSSVVSIMRKQQPMILELCDKSTQTDTMPMDLTTNKRNRMVSTIDTEMQKRHTSGALISAQNCDSSSIRTSSDSWGAVPSVTPTSFDSMDLSNGTGATQNSSGAPSNTSSTNNQGTSVSLLLDYLSKRMSGTNGSSSNWKNFDKSQKSLSHNDGLQNGVFHQSQSVLNNSGHSGALGHNGALGQGIHNSGHNGTSGQGIHNNGHGHNGASGQSQSFLNNSGHNGVYGQSASHHGSGQSEEHQNDSSKAILQLLQILRNSQGGKDPSGTISGGQSNR